MDFDAAADGNRHALGGHDLLGRRGDAHQARGALAVDAHPGNRDGQAGAQRGLARDVGPARALLQGRAHDHVLDLGRIDAGARDGMSDRMGAERLGAACR